MDTPEHQTDGTAQPDGIDVEAVTAYLADHVPSLTPPLQWVRLPGGHSNLTYRIIGSSGREAVIRRPPEGELLPTEADERLSASRWIGKIPRHAQRTFEHLAWTAGKPAVARDEE